MQSTPRCYPEHTDITNCDYFPKLVLPGLTSGPSHLVLAIQNVKPRKLSNKLHSTVGHGFLLKPLGVQSATSLGQLMLVKGFTCFQHLVFNTILFLQKKNVSYQTFTNVTQKLKSTVVLSTVLPLCSHRSDEYLF